MQPLFSKFILNLFILKSRLWLWIIIALKKVQKTP